MASDDDPGRRDGPATGAVRVGDLLPPVVLRDQDGEPVVLRDLRGRTSIVFFFPREGSPGCVTQSCTIRDNWPLLRRHDIAVYGISPGDCAAHQRLRARYELPFPLLEDDDQQLAWLLGIRTQRTVLGLPVVLMERATLIVDPDGCIRALLRQVKATAHFELLRKELGLGVA